MDLIRRDNDNCNKIQQYRVRLIGRCFSFDSCVDVSRFTQYLPSGRRSAIRMLFKSELQNILSAMFT
jgi:hypothetical protein